jgi:hypothetical protein
MGSKQGGVSKPQQKVAVRQRLKPLAGARGLKPPSGGVLQPDA